MKKLFLIKNPEVFQGEKYIESTKNYFEGWYFKNTNKKSGISFIPGIHINEKEQKAFIQVITKTSTYFINYDIKDFKYNHNPFYIKIGNNFFSTENIHIDIKDKTQNLTILGDIKYSKSLNINKNILNPNIMGPFSYIPFMECNHAIISMKAKANGTINIKNKKIKFKDDTAYIEKDWGSSFPKSYIWCQGNNFKNSNTSFFISIADIPFKIFNFRGIICSLIIDNKEYRFSTYNNSKIIEYEVKNNQINITLKKGKYYLNVKSTSDSGLKLVAPVKGKMEKEILETISANLTVTLKNDHKIIFEDTSTNCGLEMVSK